MKKCKLVYLNKEYEIFEGTLLSEFIRKNGIEQEMPCGGMGKCGKCRVEFLYGAPKANSIDKRFLSESDIEKGIRLACRAVISGDAEIRTLWMANDDSEKFLEKPDGDMDVTKKRALVALDIGTTTIAAALMPKDKIGNDSTSWEKMTIMNHQRSFGADVISRIQAANQGNEKELRSCVLSDIKSIVGNLEVERMVIAGNTTMLHILMGDSCEGLGKAPYNPVRLSYPPVKLSDLLTENEEKVPEGNCILAPGISAFVGADIVSGMYALSFYNIPKGKHYMLIDLGTNGEMAVADSEKISVCSTAAGPVFEGGGISCGMPGVNGAIEHITLKQQRELSGDNDGAEEIISKLQVIGGGEPLGICGSGVLELVSELRRTKTIDETGLLRDRYFDEGITLYENGTDRISFSQNDIRAVQLAKAAIRSGIDTLLKAHGVSALEIDKVYLAGGFSEHLDVEKVRNLKLLPEEFLRDSVCECVGNTSLKGCRMVLADDEYRQKMDDIVSRSTEIKLAETDAFGDAFIEAMNF